MEVRYLLSMAKKWYWLILLAIFLGGGVGFTVDLLKPKIYQASTTLFVTSPSRNDYNALTGDQEAAASFALFPQSSSVLAATLVTTNENFTVSQLSSMLIVNHDLNTQFVTIEINDTDPVRAARLTNEIAKQSITEYQIALTNSNKVQFVEEELNRIELEIQGLETDLQNVQSQVIPGAETPQQTTRINQITTSLAAQRQSYSQLAASYTSLTSIEIQIMEEANVPNKPIGLGPTPIIAIGMLVGLIAIIAVIFFIEQADDILRTPTKVSQASGLSTILSVKRLTAVSKQALSLASPQKDVDDDVTVRLKPYSPIIKAETFMKSANELEDNESIDGDTGKRKAVVPTPYLASPTPTTTFKTPGHTILRFELPEAFLTLGVLLRGERGQINSNGSNINLLLITSPADGDGKTLVASHIALGLARVGVEVILIDANLRNPDIHNIFGLANVNGLTSLLNDEEYSNTASQIRDPVALLQKTREPHLKVLSGGPVVNTSAELLSSDAMNQVLERLSQKAFIVIDSPPVLTASEPVILANKCDSILMVVNARSTTALSFKRSLEILNRVNTNVIGVVLNQVGKHS